MTNNVVGAGLRTQVGEPESQLHVCVSESEDFDDPADYYAQQYVRPRHSGKQYLFAGKVWIWPNLDSTDLDSAKFGLNWSGFTAVQIRPGGMRPNLGSTAVWIRCSLPSTSLDLSDFFRILPDLDSPDL